MRERRTMIGSHRRRAGAFATLAIVAMGGVCFAQTPAALATGCAAFDWPITEPQAAMGGAIAKIASGASAPQDFELTLAPFDQVSFPTKPERTPREPGTYGGFVTFAPPAGKFLQVTLSDEAWIDVVQSGATVKSAAFSGRKGCDGVRKSVRFPISAIGPVTLQLSGADNPAIKIDIRGIE